MTGYDWRGLHTGGEVSDEAYAQWVEDLDTLYRSEAWQTAAVASGLVPIWRGDEEFEAHVREREQVMADISREIGVSQ